MNSYCRNILCVYLLLTQIGMVVYSQSAYAGMAEAQAAYVRNDFVTAAKELKPLAAQGDVTAQVQLGMMYVQGIGVERNYKEAIGLFLKAAATNGDLSAAKAQHNLGVAYENGMGVPKDLAKAAYWYKKGAENGDVSAQSNLGTLYLEGGGVDKDFKKAFYWFEKAASQGDIEAYINLGLMYFEGLGVPKNLVNSYFFLYMAANHGGREVPLANKNLSMVMKKISPSQLEQGKKLVNEALSMQRK